jgi:hypothetical protein
MTERKPIGGQRPPATPHRPPARPKWGWVAVAAALAIVTVVVPLVVLTVYASGPGPIAGQPDAPNAKPGRATVAEPIRPGEQVTQERLAQISGSDFYWSLLKRQMTQPVSQISAAFFKPGRFGRDDSYGINQLAIDHRNGEYALATTNYLDGRVLDIGRCVDGKRYVRNVRGGKWLVSEIIDECSAIPEHRLGAATDGIVASGLSETQAVAVVASLRDKHKGFAHPKRPTLVTAGGKQYIRQVVDYRPIKLEDDRYWGTVIFTRAFEETGEDPDTWPWYSGFGPGQGLHVVYYVDPATLQPVASIKRATPTLDDKGREQTRYDQTTVYNYAFPARVPRLTLNDARPLSLTLPEGWNIPP